MPIAAGIAATGALISALASYKLNQRQNRQNMALQDRYNMKNWALQNRYNSPSAQMARLKAAGLNPNLIYQNGGANIGAGEIGSPQPMDVQAPDFSTAISHGVDVFNAGLQAESVQSQVDLNAAQRSKFIQDSINQALTNRYLPMEKRAQLSNTAAQTANLNAQSSLLAQQKDYYSQLTGLTRQQVQNATLEYTHVQEQINNLKSQRKLNDAQINQINKIISQIDRNNDLLSAQFQKTVLEQELVRLQSEGQKISNRFSEKDIERLQQVIDQLQFSNSPESRFTQLAAPFAKDGLQGVWMNDAAADYHNKHYHNANPFKKYWK